MIVHPPKTYAEASEMYRASHRQMAAERARREGCPRCHGAGHYVTPKGASWDWTMCAHREEATQ